MACKTYDAINRLTEDVYTYDTNNPKSIRTTILYEKAEDHPLADGRINRYSYYLDNATSPIAQTGYDFDSFNRVTSKFCSINGKEFTSNITYNKNQARKLLELLNGRPLRTTDYAYDNMGRISSITADGYTTYYTYDEYGQLTRKDNQLLDKTFQYEYNGIGNIMYVRAYPYTVPGIEPSGNPTTTSFAYDTSNLDRLSSYNNKSITYNANV